MNPKKVFSLVAALGMILGGVVGEIPATDPVTVLCVPGRHGVASYYPVVITVETGKYLYGKFYYPDAGTGNQFAANSLPGLMMTHGFGQGYYAIEWQARELAENCFVVLIFNYRGQGWDWEVSTEFSFYTDAERDDLNAVVSELKKGPIEGTLDLVDNARLGMLGYSQGGIATWRALADPDLRANFLAFAPSDAAHSPPEVQLPNNCIHAALASLLDPARKKEPWNTQTPTPTPFWWLYGSGALWDDDTYDTLYDAYVNTRFGTLQAFMATRDFSATELPQTSIPDTPHPHTYVQISPYDAGQVADTALTAWATLTFPTYTATSTPTPGPSLTPTSTPTPSDTPTAGPSPTPSRTSTRTPGPTPTPSPSNTAPYHQLRVGQGGHSDPPWEGSVVEQYYRFLSKLLWFQAHLQPTYVSTPTPLPPVGSGTPTYTPTTRPVPPPYQVEYVVDSYLTATASLTPTNTGTPTDAPQHSPTPTATPTTTHTPTRTLTPTSGPSPTATATFTSTPIPTFTPVQMVTFEMRTADQWPPAVFQSATPVQFYFHGGGAAKIVTPPPTPENYDLVQQTLVPGATYNLETAVVENPKFYSWATALAPTTQQYTSAVLAQDVTLYGPPVVQVFTNATDISHWQLHVRVLEQLPDGEQRFVTRANLCDWSFFNTPGEFHGTPFPGEPRFHIFHAGSRIVFEVTTVDKEEYHPNGSVLYLTPRLASFNMQLYRGKNGQNSNVTLPLLPASPGEAIFEPDGGLRPSRSAREGAGRAAPVGQPLRLQAYVFPEAANPGGWRAWSLLVRFECSGGEGAVSCPTDDLLLSDGADQSFTYEARDEAGNVATVTLSGLNIDRTPPQLVSRLPDTQTFCSGAVLPLDFTVSDALSGLAATVVTFNGEAARAGETAPLRAGANTLRMDAQDIAGNRTVQEDVVQVNYTTALDFPPEGGVVNPEEPLPFHFTIPDACSGDGRYRGAVGELWFTGPDGVEIPARWADGQPGNRFAVDGEGVYHFDADVSRLASGLWTARAHLDDGNDYKVTFVMP